MKFLLPYKKMISKAIIGFAFIVFSSYNSSAQNMMSDKIAKTIMDNWKDTFAFQGGKAAKWSYDMGVILKGMEGLWYRTANPVYFNYIQKQMDCYVTNDGNIITYKKEEFNIDHINNGKLLLLLYKVTEKEKYWKAAQLLRDQIRNHPRTNEGGFWHKKVYPYQMWLDGLYMGQPFYAEYADFEEKGTTDTSFNDIANQFIWMEKHARDAKTGLIYHAWDESKQQEWANKTTGTSPNFWARAMGWYADALVDVLDFFPKNHPKQKELVAILNRLINALEKVQDAKTGLWYDVLAYNGPNKEKNYFEASASCQYVYAIAKGVRKGYLPASKIAIAKKGYEGILKTFVKEENGQTNLHGTVSVSGLGGKPYRDGSFEYYMREKVVVNDAKGIGAFLLATNEMEMLPTLSVGKNKTIVLDNYFNSEKKKDITGKEVFWHYKWNEKSNGGYSLLGNTFNKYGVATETLNDAPTAQNLAKASFYLIVDADNATDNPKPNYVSDKDVIAIENWVKAGGVLILFHNDKGNAEFEHFNKLGAKLGIVFNEVSLNRVEKNQYEMGAVKVDTSNEIFKANLKLYLKEISTLKLSGTAKAVVKSENGDVIMAYNRIGKGFVFALGDPWIYNEYVDGRKLPTDFQNIDALNKLIPWLIKQSKK